MADQQKGLIFLTGLWKAQSRSGSQYLQGRLGVGGKLLVFKNTKKKETDPDWTVCIGEWQQADDTAGGRPGRRRDGDDDVPF